MIGVRITTIDFVIVVGAIFKVGVQIEKNCCPMSWAKWLIDYVLNLQTKNRQILFFEENVTCEV